MVKESIISTKAYGFGINIIKMTKLLTRSYENIVLIKQIIRSATSIGANIEEALGANSRKEFIHSMNIAKKEARETIYWLKLIRDTNINLKEKLEILLGENQEIINILTKIVKTSSREN
ncbi:MAG: four helix bundle protein [Candidatus Berkelbacteria bacterium]|nr:four helix bundle protein [Candidatus Berkelbacteria bacterium]